MSGEIKKWAPPECAFKGPLKGKCPEADPIMQTAWFSCLRWAIGHNGILKQFRKETGNRYFLPLSGLEKMIDESTGAQDAFILDFVDWFNASIWGDSGMGEECKNL